MKVKYGLFYNLVKFFNYLMIGYKFKFFVVLWVYFKYFYIIEFD